MIISKGNTLFFIFDLFYSLYTILYLLLHGPYILFISGYNFYLITVIFSLGMFGRYYVNFDLVDSFEAYYVFVSFAILLMFLYYSLYDPKIFKNVSILNIFTSVASLSTIKSILKMFYLTHVEKKRIIVEEIEKSFKIHNI